MKIQILKSGNLIVVNSKDPDLIAQLESQVHFTYKDFHHKATTRQSLIKVNKALAEIEATAELDDEGFLVGLSEEAESQHIALTEDQELLKSRFKNPVEIKHTWCCGKDVRGRFTCSYGFYPRIRRYLKEVVGFDKVFLKDMQPHKNPHVFEPQWDNLYQSFAEWGMELRKSQEEFLIKLFSHSQGRFELTTAFGKSFMLGVVGIICPHARIHIVTKRATVLEERIYPELCGMLADVGIVKATKQRFGHRVMCYSAGSLQHSDGEADFLFADEVHELAADSYAPKIGRYRFSRNFGLSASQDMRPDEKDFRLEGLFGPIIMRRSHLESVEEGIVSQLKVKWRNVSMDYDPCHEVYDTVEKERMGIWRNDYRNDLIAEDANLYDDDEQVLIVVRTLIHALELKKRLPNFTLAYRGSSLTPTKRRKYVKAGLMQYSDPVMTDDRLRQITSAFSRHRLKKAICTTIWNVGVDFRDLAVLIRAEAGSSPISDVQIPGRAVRLGKETEKPYGIVHDYMDNFNSGFKRKSGDRRKSYTRIGFEQELPPGFRVQKTTKKNTQITSKNLTLFDMEEY